MTADTAHVIDLLPPDHTVRYAGQPVAAPTRREALAIAEAARIGYQNAGQCSGLKDSVV
ncbi:hypothetical protein OG884_35660 [Streptosporangium sp. NBC_01755]|uniref:hypothetical protein n=1 Tax=unclassified Streptosporangium TaxID=2632669 RepID=UPI002DD7AF53|nr:MULTISPECIES: hypothetical protein [unclassified Streptosporangium]WSA28458.1 hypothetical protein OIE13_11595 [Streptosporangium sp. NBC_01810]WSD00051.1 hypothetical protein OG884_35660 [Streptosporangium sp. NBC_01755]